MSAIIGPVAPYNNLPIEPQFYNPSRFVIDDITLGITTVVQATENMNYVIGQQVRLIIPEENGSWQLNNQTAYVISLPAADSVEIDINSSLGVDTFIPGSGVNSPQILPIGNINSGKLNSSGNINTGTYIPGSFINVS